MRRDQKVGAVPFVDGVSREVIQEPSGRQYVLDDGQKVYGVWLRVPDDDVEPAVIVEAME